MSRIHCPTTLLAIVSLFLIPGCGFRIPPKQTVRGRVLLKDTSIPVANFRVSICPPHRVAGSTRTDAEGRFEVRGRAFYPVFVIAQDDTQSGHARLTEPTNEDVVIRVWPDEFPPKPVPATSPSTP